MSRLERWSRLKRNAQKEEDASPATSTVSEPVDETSTEPNAAIYSESEQTYAAEEPLSPTPEREIEPGSLDHTLPDPETLEAGSDFSAYMVPGVSGPLRRQALKRLWATGNYNVRDGLDDYDADYNKLLKPMASELASKLRRWTHKVEETVDKQVEDTQPETQKDVVASEQTKGQSGELEDEPSTLRANSANVVKNNSVDDQSDSLTDAQKKT